MNCFLCYFYVFVVLLLLQKEEKKTRPKCYKLNGFHAIHKCTLTSMHTYTHLYFLKSFDTDFCFLQENVKMHLPLNHCKCPYSQWKRRVSSMVSYFTLGWCVKLCIEYLSFMVSLIWMPNTITFVHNEK